MRKVFLIVLSGIVAGILFFCFLVPHPTTITLGDQSNSYSWSPDHDTIFPDGQYDFSNDQYFEVRSGNVVHQATYILENDNYIIKDLPLQGRWSLESFTNSTEHVQVSSSDPRKITVNLLNPNEDIINVVSSIFISFATMAIFVLLFWTTPPQPA